MRNDDGESVNLKTLAIAIDVTVFRFQLGDGRILCLSFEMRQCGKGPKALETSKQPSEAGVLSTYYKAFVRHDGHSGGCL
ncbi:uncharacterized protein FTOL_00924 [Fusarium torulosum]|uniref:Uncharacterized protein n=1 Tax=Fusarium torulosum TaxID=33205 RepID=A0AAE8LZ10_9HYPO|nr:uncharacterized protein FTOL_00924 [Fusarium torulosum]